MDNRHRIAPVVEQDVGQFPALAKGRSIVLGLADSKECLSLVPGLLRRTIVDVAMRWEADTTIIEDTELGRALAQDLRRAGLLRPILIRPLHEKRVRLEAQSARFEAGQVHLPQEAPWLGEYVKELLAFPAGKHDDQVDATSQALDYLTSRNARSGPLVRRTPERRQVVERREVVRR